jgi:hypothetical protein
MLPFGDMMTPRSSREDRRFGGKFRLYLQGEKLSVTLAARIYLRADGGELLVVVSPKEHPDCYQSYSELREEENISNQGEEVEGGTDRRWACSSSQWSNE